MDKDFATFLDVEIEEQKLLITHYSEMADINSAFKEKNAYYTNLSQYASAVKSKLEEVKMMYESLAMRQQVH